MAGKLPNADRGFVDPRKVLDYLLSLNHPTGKYKAAFFFNHGYSRARWARLRADLLALGRQGDVIASHRTPYGKKYVTVGCLRTPSGREVQVVGVWIVRAGESFPRLVTVVPGGSTP